MPLCPTCASIPFSSPAPFNRSHHDLTLSGDTYLHPVRYRPPQSTKDEAPKDSSAKDATQPEPSSPRPPSHPHHPTLSTLTASAATCPLCKLILAAADHMLDEAAAQIDNVGEARARLRRTPDFDAGLWVTGRVNGGKGIIVWTGSKDGPDTRPGRAGRWMFPVAAFGVAAEAWQKSSGNASERWFGEGYEIHEANCRSVLTKSAHDFLRTRACYEGPGHRECRMSWEKGAGVWVPPRLIDSGIMDGMAPRIVDTTCGTWAGDGTRQMLRYAALSYCVDGPEGRAVLEELPEINVPEPNPPTFVGFNIVGQPIEKEGTPKLFWDTIQFARALSVRFVWIDALCIPLEQEKTWKRGSENVADVYRHAELTIAASAATSVDDGLLVGTSEKEMVEVSWGVKEKTDEEEQEWERVDRDSIKAFPLQLDREIIDNYYVTLRDTPLSKHPWSFTERVLSRRIVHIAPDQVYFECLGEDLGAPGMSGNEEGEKWVATSDQRGRFLSEDGLHLKRRFQSVYAGPMSEILSKHQGERQEGSETYTKEDREAALASWHSLLRSYGQHSATSTTSSRLAAIAPLARLHSKIILSKSPSDNHVNESEQDQLSQNSNDQGHIAGHFRPNLIPSLLWQGLGMQGPRAKNSGSITNHLPPLDGPSWSWASFPGTAAGGFPFIKPEQIHSVATLQGAYAPEDYNPWLEIKAAVVPLEPVPLEALGEQASKGLWMRLRSVKGGGEGASPGFDLIPREFDECLEVVKGMRLWAVVLVKVVSEVDEGACESGRCKPLPVTYWSLIVGSAGTESDDTYRADELWLRRLGWMAHGPEFFGEGELDEKIEVKLV